MRRNLRDAPAGPKRLLRDSHLLYSPSVAASNCWLPVLNAAAVLGLLHIVGKVRRPSGKVYNPERNERNGTGSNCYYTDVDARYAMEKLVLMYGSGSRVVYLPRREDRHPADSIEAHQAYENSSRLPGNFVWRRRLYAYKRGVGDVTTVFELSLGERSYLWLTLEQEGNVIVPQY